MDRPSGRDETAHGPRQPGTDRSAFRADIEGMRAIAVVAVMWWHAGLPVIRGGFVGVDVFFVISGFLMTTILLRDVDQLGRVRMVRFYVRRIRRLLPAVAAALLGTAVITVVVLPPVRWATIAADIGGSALYAVNWILAARATDYLAQGQAPSPVLHFWSLSIEEQFYLLLPVLLALVCWAIKGARARRRVIAALAVAGTVAGFAFGVWYTAVEPARAYFVTPARAWELAVGGVVAVFAAALRRLDRRVSAALGWAGLVTVLASLVFIDSHMPFPGVVAAAPTLGTAAVLVAGLRPNPSGPVAVLKWRPAQLTGALSYSLYLWHWPVLVAATVLYGDRTGDLARTVAAVALLVSVVPAWLSYRFVEERWRRPRVASYPADGSGPRAAPTGTVAGAFPERAVHRAAGRLLAVCTVISLAGASGVYVLIETARTAIQPAALTLLAPFDRALPPPNPALPPALGAQALGDGGIPERAPATDTVDALTPVALDAREDASIGLSGLCNEGRGSAVAAGCRGGDPDGSVTVVVAGDSHARQWLPAVETIAQLRGWKLIAYTKDSCPLTAAVHFAVGRSVIDRSCATWVDKVLGEVIDADPDLVITSGRADYSVPAAGGGRLTRAASRQVLADGYRAVWEQLAGRGIPVAVLADNFLPRFDVVDCVSAHPTELTRCAFAPKRADPQIVAFRSERWDGVRLINLRRAICPAHRCPAVVGNVLVYRDGSHMTSSYVRTLTARLDRALQEDAA